MTGKEVTLRLLAKAEDLDKCGWAMTSLKQSMAWDELRYGREYDLDIFHIVAVASFSMGAMENSSLNVFNVKYVLADEHTATDADFGNVQGVIGHEYFHNWSGNRVTCRDWFQLSLKEGFTVFRDQEFSSDLGSRTMKRISAVDILRAYQFAEAAGPMSHPVRPASFVTINNFYSVTVYNVSSRATALLPAYAAIAWAHCRLAVAGTHSRLASPSPVKRACCHHLFFCCALLVAGRR
jgi:aminopeptidase N